MKNLILFIQLIFIVVFSSFAQTDYLNDNVLYKTLYPKDLYEFIKNNPNALLIDVRSPGEYSDTSRYGSLNIGRLKNAINIPIDSLEKNLSKLMLDKDKTIILYCSHSQRSRRVGKTLAENGFRSVYNLNGGMSWMNQADTIDFPGKTDLLKNSIPFKSLSAEDTYNLIKEKKGLVIIDVRPVDQYNSSDTVEANNIGRIKNSINIPESDNKIEIAKIEKYRDRDLLIYDSNGALSFHVARFLNESGIKNIYTILGGLSSFIGIDKSTNSMRKEILELAPRYQLLNVKESIDLFTSNKDVKIIDVRPTDEFNNLSKHSWKKIGRLKHSVNLQPDGASLQSQEIPKDKDAIIFVYGTDKTAHFSKLLTDAGYINVNCLATSFWSFIFTYANVPGFGNIRDVMENYEGLY